MDLWTILLLLLGLAALTVGAEFLVRGSADLAARLGISSLVIGLTVVAFGTSAPEMAVSVKAALVGQADIALGNVVGSNIFNVLLILGISALITPLAVGLRLVRIDVPLMIAVSVLTLLLGLDGAIGRPDGFLLFAGIVVYTVFAVYFGRREPRGQDGAGDSLPGGARGRIAVQLFFVIVGLGLLVLGARWFVDGAVTLARTLGVSELTIGLTIVAAGTSLPEVAASVMAAIKGERDIAVGNVVGSNIFNILAVLGASAAVSSEGVAVAVSAMWFDIPVMIAVAVACLPIFFTGYSIARWEGGLFLGYYVLYTTYVVLAATGYAGLPTFRTAMVWLVIPLTVITLAVIVTRELRAMRRLRPAQALQTELPERS